MTDNDISLAMIDFPLNFECHSWFLGNEYVPPTFVRSRNTTKYGIGEYALKYNNAKTVYNHIVF